jgi:hypothetical protein
VSHADTPNFLLHTSRGAGVSKEAKGADGGGPTCQAGSGAANSEKALAIGIPRVKGGISAMAKKTAKGGKKKGGKKR